MTANDKAALPSRPDQPGSAASNNLKGIYTTFPRSCTCEVADYQEVLS